MGAFGLADGIASDVFGAMNRTGYDVLSETITLLAHRRSGRSQDIGLYLLMRTKDAVVFLGLGFVCAAASCTRPMDCCGLQPSVAIVYGVVRTEAQEPVPSAGLTVEAFTESCEDGYLFAANGVATDSTGFYRLVLGGADVSQAETCVVVRVAAGDSYGAATQSGALVTFVHQPDTQPIDSVRVDVVVPNP